MKQESRRRLKAEQVRQIVSTLFAALSAVDYEELRSTVREAVSVRPSES